MTADALINLVLEAEVTDLKGRRDLKNFATQLRSQLKAKAEAKRADYEARGWPEKRVQEAADPWDMAGYNRAWITPNDKVDSVDNSSHADYLNMNSDTLKALGVPDAHKGYFEGNDHRRGKAKVENVLKAGFIKKNSSHEYVGWQRKDLHRVAKHYMSEHPEKVRQGASVQVWLKHPDEVNHTYNIDFGQQTVTKHNGLGEPIEVLRTKIFEAVSKRAVRLIAQELDTGRSRMSEVPRKVRDASRASLPDKVTVWRSVALHSENPEIRPETGVVSTTRNPRVAMNMATNYPVLMGKDKFIAPKPAILRYEVPRDRVHAYVPGMIDQARAEHGDELKKMKITGRRSYQRMSVHDVFDQTHREDEVLADVSGLTPEVLHFHGGEQVADQEHMHAIHDLVQGRAQGTGAEYIADRKKYGTYFRDEPKAAQEYDDFFKKARHHFREDVNESEDPNQLSLKKNDYDGFHEYEIHHQKHGHIGLLSGHFKDGHLDVTSVFLHPEYLQKRGIEPHEGYGNWWTSADMARDHEISRNLLGVSGVRKITQELRRHGVKSIGSSERNTGTRLHSYAREHGVPQNRIKGFDVKTRRLESADQLIRATLSEIAKPAKVKFSAMGPSPEVPESLRSMDFYHGVDNDEAAHKILASGRLEPATYGHNTFHKGYSSPRPDKVYLTGDHKHAARIALSGTTLGDDSEQPDLNQGRYGYVFRVAGRDLNNVEADEDNIERTYWNTHGGGPAGLGVHRGLVDLGKSVLSQKDHETLLGAGSFGRRVRVAKKLASHLTPDVHHDLILSQGAHVAHGGPIKIVGAWRIDKTRNDEFHWDGSDLFQKAEPLHHLIGKGLK